MAQRGLTAAAKVTKPLNSIPGSVDEQAKIATAARREPRVGAVPGRTLGPSGEIRSNRRC